MSPSGVQFLHNSNSATDFQNRPPGSKQASTLEDARFFYAYDRRACLAAEAQKAIRIDAHHALASLAAERSERSAGISVSLVWHSAERAAEARKQAGDGRNRNNTLDLLRHLWNISTLVEVF
jgi:hypothetical protein